MQILPGNIDGNCISQQSIKENFHAQATSGTSGSRDLLANRCLKQMETDHEKEVQINVCAVAQIWAPGFGSEKGRMETAAKKTPKLPTYDHEGIWHNSKCKKTMHKGANRERR